MHFFLANAHAIHPSLLPMCLFTSSPHFSQAPPQRPSMTFSPSLRHAFFANVHALQPCLPAARCLISKPHFFHASPQRPSTTFSSPFMHFVLAKSHALQAPSALPCVSRSASI